MSGAFQKSQDWFVIDCCKCSFSFAVLNNVDGKWRKNHRTFWCPACNCSQSYSGMSKAEKRAEEAESKLAEERRNAQRQRSRAALAESLVVAVNKQYKRIRDRVKNGVCPCCNRTFQNLAAHMKTEHKEFGNHDLLRAIRTAYGMTQAALAEEIWVNPAHVSRYENNRPVSTPAQARIESWMAQQAA